jgi:glutamine synthetase adenylyltransferase
MLAGAEARQRDEAQLSGIVEPFVFRRYLDFAAFGAMRELHALIRTEAIAGGSGPAGRRVCSRSLRQTRIEPDLPVFVLWM